MGFNQHTTISEETRSEMFYRKVVAGPNGCHVWTASLIGRGQPYAQFKVNGKMVLGHRWAYEFHRGPIPEGTVLDHLCRNTRCVNPWHLETVTVSVNNQRGSNGKLTDAQVREICTRRASGEPQKDLANEFGVSRSLVSRLTRGQRRHGVTRS